jgi:hypothetical protein
MTTKIDIPDGWDADATKLRIIQALVTVALKSGLTFDQFAEAVAVSGITFPTDGGRDCTDIEADVRVLLGITPVDEAESLRREGRVMETMTRMLEILRRLDARAGQASNRPSVA